MLFQKPVNFIKASVSGNVAEKNHMVFAYQCACSADEAVFMAGQKDVSLFYKQNIYSVFNAGFFYRKVVGNDCVFINNAG